VASVTTTPSSAAICTREPLPHLTDAAGTARPTHRTGEESRFAAEESVRSLAIELGSRA